MLFVIEEIILVVYPKIYTQHSGTLICIIYNSNCYHNFSISIIMHYNYLNLRNSNSIMQQQSGKTFTLTDYNSLAHGLVEALTSVHLEPVSLPFEEAGFLLAADMECRCRELCLRMCMAASLRGVKVEV